MSRKVIAYVEEKWTEELLSFFDKGSAPETRTKLFKIHCINRRHISCTCNPGYRIPFNDSRVRIVTAGCPHLSAVCAGRLAHAGRMKTKDGRRWNTVSTITLTRHGHALFDWRHVAIALE